MKKSILIIAFMFCSAISFAQTASDITARWLLTGLPKTEKLTKEEEEKFKKALNFILDIKSDKKFSLSTMGKVVNGTWLLKGKNIILTDDINKKVVTFTIKQYTKNEMHILVEGKEMTLGRAKTK